MWGAKRSFKARRGRNFEPKKSPIEGKRGGQRELGGARLEVEKR